MRGGEEKDRQSRKQEQEEEEYFRKRESQAQSLGIKREYNTFKELTGILGS